MEGKQVACPECGSVSTLDRCWIGMKHECDNCHHVFKIASDNICLDAGLTAGNIVSVSGASPVSFTCPTCGSKQQSSVKPGESMARCGFCSSMVNVSTIVKKACPHCHNMISGNALICPACGRNTAQAAAPVSAVSPVVPVQTSAVRNVPTRRSGAFKVIMLILLAVVALAGGGVGTYFVLKNKNSADSNGSAGNSGVNSGSGSSSSSGETASDLAGKIKKVDQSVVCIVVKGNDGQEWVGTGFAVAPKYIITNRHVAKGAQGGKVLIGNPKWKKQVTTATVREISQAYDLAWLELDDENITLEPMILQERLLEQGNKVYTLGYPGYSYKQSNAIPQLTVADGIIKSNNRIMDRNPCYESSATINGGNSGGPLVNENFQVVGVNTFKMKAEYAEGCFYSIRVEVIKSAFPELWKEIRGE